MDERELIKARACKAITTVMDRVGIAMRDMGAQGDLATYNDIFAEGMGLMESVIQFAYQGLLFEQLPESDKDKAKEIGRLKNALVEIRETIKQYVEHDQQTLETLTKLIGDG